MTATGGAIVIGWLLADLLSGLVHWLEDRMARARWPIIGPYVVVPNRLHHRDPIAFTRCGVIERNWTSWLAVAQISTAWIALSGPSIIWATATIGGMVANEVHAWAHVPGATPDFAKPFQRAGIIQSPAGHAGHHRPGAMARYCVLTDLINPLIDSIGLWAKLERGLAAVGLHVDQEAV